MKYLIAFLLVFLMASVVFAAEVPKQETESYVTIKKEFIDLMLKYIHEYKAKFEAANKLANYWEGKYDDAEACVRENAQKQLPTTTCFQSCVGAQCERDQAF